MAKWAQKVQFKIIFFKNYLGISQNSLPFTPPPPTSNYGIDGPVQSHLHFISNRYSRAPRKSMPPTKNRLMTITPESGRNLGSIAKLGTLCAITSNPIRRLVYVAAGGGGFTIIILNDGRREMLSGFHACAYNSCIFRHHPQDKHCGVHWWAGQAGGDELCNVRVVRREDMSDDAAR
jgi:hypothetical protein